MPLDALDFPRSSDPAAVRAMWLDALRDVPRTHEWSFGTVFLRYASCGTVGCAIGVGTAIGLWNEPTLHYHRVAALCDFVAGIASRVAVPFQALVVPLGLIALYPSDEAVLTEFGRLYPRGFQSSAARVADVLEAVFARHPIPATTEAHHAL